MTPPTAAVEGLLGMALLLTALYLQSESFLGPMIDGIALQSILLGALIGWLAVTGADRSLAVVAVLIVGVRGFLIPRILRGQMRAAGGSSREIRAAQRTTGHLLAAVVVALISWFLFQETLAPALPAAPGAALPFVLLAEGFLLLATRSASLAQILGYLEEENAIVYAAILFVAAFPLLIETVVLLDVLGVVLLSFVLGRQRALLGRPEAEWREELAG